MTDKLPPEVAEAITALDAMTYAGSRTHAHWSCVKDHLHRLAEENARLKATVEAWNQWVKDGMRVALPPLKLEDGE